MLQAMGRHILVEFSDCNANILNDVAAIEIKMIEAAQVAGATVISSSFHHFSPYGVSGVVVIQESHLAIHTWPEFRYAALDLFTCGDSVDPWVAFDHLKKSFEANYSAIEMLRGSHNLIRRCDFLGQNSAGPPEKNLDRPFDRPFDKSPDKPYAIERNVWFTDRDQNQAMSLRYTGEILFDEKSPYQRVRVLSSTGYGRLLASDDRIICAESDEAFYHEMITHPAMFTHQRVSKVLILGGGDGGAAREVLKHPSIESVTMVEIDEVIVKAAKKFLPHMASGFIDPKLKLHISDGVEFVKTEPSEFYDLIIVDGSGTFHSVSFLQEAKRILKSDGILVLQSDSPTFRPQTFSDAGNLLLQVFGYKHFHPYLFYAPSYPTGMWSFMLATKGDNHPISGANPLKIQSFSEKIGLLYYNQAIHFSAFSLPTFVRTMLGESLQNNRHPKVEISILET